ncbi:hypothetical protein ACOSP7_019827 [Xanthoceras sorbifolium]
MEKNVGGLLIGAVLNIRPDLFKAAVAGVPFVDVVTTMLDPTIPLSNSEWEVFYFSFPIISGICLPNLLFEKLQEDAFIYTFILKALDMIPASGSRQS